MQLLEPSNLEECDCEYNGDFSLNENKIDIVLDGGQYHRILEIKNFTKGKLVAHDTYENNTFTLDQNLDLPAFL